MRKVVEKKKILGRRRLGRNLGHSSKNGIVKTLKKTRRRKYSSLDSRQIEKLRKCIVKKIAL